MLAISKTSDLAAYDELIASKPEFGISVNLSRGFEEPNSSLKQNPLGQHDRFSRHGLAWMMALARVEVAASLAAYEDLKKPFRASNPTQFELKAYRELLLDALRTHFWTLKTDPVFKKVLSRSHLTPTSETVAYLRRLTMTIKMAEGVRYFFADRLTQENASELSKWNRVLRRSRDSLAASLNAGLSLATQSTSDSDRLTKMEDSDTKVCLDQCLKLLEQTRRQGKK